MSRLPRDDPAAPHGRDESLAPSSMASLLAIATIRRWLLELGVEETTDLSAIFEPSLEVWVVRPLTELGRASPVQLLSKPGGQAEVHRWIKRALELSRE